MNGKRIAWWVGMLAALASPATAADATLQADVFSAYVWRGITLNADPVFQPTLDVALPKGFGLTVWGNMDLGDNNGKLEAGEFSETDFTISYGYSVGALSLTAGCIEYLYPHQTNEVGALHGTRDVYGGLDFDLGLGFAASAYLYYDVEEVKDLYANAGVSYSYTCPANVTTEVGASVGYAGKDWAVYNSHGTAGGFHEYTVTLAARYPITDAMELGAQIAYTGSLDEDVLPDQETHLYGGGTLGYTF